MEEKRATPGDTRLLMSYSNQINATNGGIIFFWDVNNTSHVQKKFRNIY